MRTFCQPLPDIYIYKQLKDYTFLKLESMIIFSFFFLSFFFVVSSFIFHFVCYCLFIRNFGPIIINLLDMLQQSATTIIVLSSVMP